MSSHWEGKAGSELAEPTQDAKSFHLLDYVDMERYMNAGTQTYSRMAAVTELPAWYQPISQVPRFSISLIEVSRSEVQRTLGDPDPRLESVFLRKDRHSVLLRYIQLCVKCRKII
jgi:hypothetical protein